MAGIEQSWTELWIDSLWYTELSVFDGVCLCSND